MKHRICILDKRTGKTDYTAAISVSPETVESWNESFVKTNKDSKISFTWVIRCE